MKCSLMRLWRDNEKHNCLPKEASLMCVPDDFGGCCLKKGGGRAAKDGLSSKDLSLERFE